jgi:enoyl-CoA hydratase/carnithine racemase
MSYRNIRVEQDADGIVVVTIDDPSAKNAVNFEMNRDLVREFERIERDPAARVLILTGSGTIFCSGGNIRSMASRGRSMEPDEPTVREELYPHEADIRAVVVGLRRLAKPSIAAINGHAVGSGLGIAAGCDLRICVKDAKLGWVFTRRGIVPDDGSIYLMAQIIGYARAFEWGVTGRTLAPDEAERIGFLSAVVEPAELMTRCRALAKEIIDNVPPITAQAFKLAIAESMERGLEGAIAFGERAQRIVRATEDHTEALRAYAEKRPPRWKGK